LGSSDRRQQQQAHFALRVFREIGTAQKICQQARELPAGKEVNVGSFEPS
jgi:hypothetical protein